MSLASIAAATIAAAIGKPISDRMKRADTYYSQLKGIVSDLRETLHSGEWFHYTSRDNYLEAKAVGEENTLDGYEYKIIEKAGKYETHLRYLR